MDILIKNMEMPKCCYETDGQVVKPCDFLEVCRRKWGVNINALDIHSEACPLVALPEHGDLADKMDIIHRIDEFAETYKMPFVEDVAQDILADVMASPVIVEANNE